VEQAFQPHLRGKPLAFLSNNDGCIIARSAELKALGVRMGDPWFKTQYRPDCLAVEYRSSNYPL
jgi:DNA polymerase V